jgi:hypothetical protein
MIVMSSHEELSLRQKAFAILKQYPNLKPKAIFSMLPTELKTGRKPKQQLDYIRHLRSQWIHDYKLGQGSKGQGKPDSFHKARGWVYVDRLDFDVTPFGGKDVERVVRVGWRFSRNRNRALIWKDPQGFGRMEWHWKSGRVNIFPKQPPPATKGRVYQLFCNGFSLSGLIDSMTVLDVVLKSISLKGATALWDLGVRVPYFKVDFFRLSNGVVITGGDLSHPQGIEVEFCLPDFVEKSEAQLARNTKIIEEFLRLLKEQTTGEPKTPEKPMPKNMLV